MNTGSSTIRARPADRCVTAGRLHHARMRGGTNRTQFRRRIRSSVAPTSARNPEGS